MNTDVLRKSLDDADRERMWMRVLVVAILVGVVFFALAMTSLAGSAGPSSLGLEVMAGFIATILCVLGMGIAILQTSNANTRRILKAIELLSPPAGDPPR